MKLLSVTAGAYFLTAFIVILIGGLLTYQILEAVITKEFDNKLFAEREQFIYELRNFAELKEIYYLNIGDKIEVISVGEDPKLVSVLKDTTLFDTFENKILSFRQLQFSTNFEGQHYIVTITKSLLATEELITVVEEIILIFAVGLLVSLVLSNWIISNRIWAPFYQTLSELKTFKLSQPNQLSFQNTIIREFKELNDTVAKMADKNMRDYFNLKEFTENVSHEIQTPLSIIKSKSELLLQEVQIGSEPLKEVKKIYDAASRLARTNTGLTLLSRIENAQYFDNQPLKLKNILMDRIRDYKEMIEFKNLTVSTNFKGAPVVRMDKNLAEIMISNLVKNAIKHNKNNGDIEIFLDHHSLLISNSGHPLKNSPQTLFERFKKDNPASGSPGLGLSLVKKICSLYQFKIRYMYRDNHHKISILFRD